MRSHHSLTACLALVALFGCASAQVTDRDPYQGKKLARPDRILVYDFAATAADLPKFSTARDRFDAATDAHSAEERATGRELGARVASDLVDEIKKMGLKAVRSSAAPPPKPGDVALVGHFESIDEGSRAKRLVIGFGSGAAQMKTVVEGYQMTAQGMRKLGSGALDSGATKGPGLVVPVIVTAATANPIGLAVSGVAKAQGELSGRTTIEGAARRTADAIADELRTIFRKHGWID